MMSLVQLGRGIFIPLPSGPLKMANVVWGYRNLRLVLFKGNLSPKFSLACVTRITPMMMLYG
jgi:hypothetical protein